MRYFAFLALLSLFLARPSARACDAVGYAPALSYGYTGVPLALGYPVPVLTYGAAPVAVTPTFAYGTSLGGYGAALTGSYGGFVVNPLLTDTFVVARRGFVGRRAVIVRGGRRAVIVNRRAVFIRRGGVFVPRRTVIRSRTVIRR